MLPLLPESVARNPNGHSMADVLTELRGDNGGRHLSFRYELLDATGAVVDQLSNVVSASIDQNWLADIKRTATFTLRETGGINYLSDRIKPHVRVHMRPYGRFDWIEYPQGVFLLSSPTRTVDSRQRVLRKVDAYDLLQIFSDDLVDNRYGLPSGTVVTVAVSTLLGAVDRVLTPSTGALATDKEWEPGTSKLRIINDLLDSINYDSLSFDEEGRAVVRPYRSPQERAAEWTYATDTFGLMVPDAEQELDLFSVANKWVLVVSEPDRPSIVGTYTNSDPSSPTSTVRRGRTIVDYRTEQDAVSQSTLDARAARLAFEASQIFEAVTFQTALMPIHSGNDVLAIRYDPLAINAKYAEQSWSYDLIAGAKMKHRARRVVQV